MHQNPAWQHFHSIEELGTTDIAEAVLVHLEDDGTRPFLLRVEDGFVINLRAFNFSPDHPNEDMISLRCWVTDSRLVTVAKNPIRAVETLAANINDDDTPASIWHRLVTDLIENMSVVVRELEDKADEIEDEVVDTTRSSPTTRLNQLRRTLIQTSRFLVPQREVFNSAQKLRFPDSDESLFPFEITQDSVRYVEDLATIRDHCLLMQEEINSQNASEMNHRMLILSVAGGVFLPLTFVAGLLGMNVSGIPWATSPFAFAVVCLAMVLIAAILIVWLIRRMW